MKILRHGDSEIGYFVNPPATNDDLNRLFAAAWEKHSFRDFTPLHERSLCFVGAYHEALLVGYVNLAWDGGQHAFILDTTVHPDYRHRGIGAQMVKTAAEYAREKRVEWIHVDFEPHLREFYFDKCGFRATEAGLLKMKNEKRTINKVKSE